MATTERMGALLADRRVYQLPDHRSLIAVRVADGWLLCPVRDRRQRALARWAVDAEGRITYLGELTPWTVRDLEPLPIFA